MNRMKSTYRNRPSYFWQTRTFKTKEQMDNFIDWRKGSYEFEDISTPNTFILKYRKFRQS